MWTYKTTLPEAISWSIALGALFITPALVGIITSDKIFSPVYFIFISVVFVGGLFGLVGHNVMRSDSSKSLYPARPLLYLIVTTIFVGLLFILPESPPLPCHTEKFLQEIGRVLWELGFVFTAALALFLLAKNKAWGLFLIPYAIEVLLMLSIPDCRLNGPYHGPISREQIIRIDILFLSPFMVMFLALYLNHRSRKQSSSHT